MRKADYSRRRLADGDRLAKADVVGLTGMSVRNASNGARVSFGNPVMGVFKYERESFRF